MLFKRVLALAHRRWASSHLGLCQFGQIGLSADVELYAVSGSL